MEQGNAPEGDLIATSILVKSTYNKSELAYLLSCGAIHARYDFGQCATEE